MRYKEFIAIYTITILISIFTFLPSFQLGLFGDDWLAFWRYLQHLGPKSSGEWNHLTYFLTPYGAQDILMGILRNIYGYESTYYYLTSFVLRLIAAFSFYPLVFFLTKSKLASFFAILFFSVTTIGFDTTNWVFNMPSFITITLFNLCLYFFLKAREKNKSFSLFLAGIFYYFAYITTPIRMHGSLPFIFLLEAFWVLQNRIVKTLKKSIIRFTIFLTIFLIIRYTGHSQGPIQEASERFSLGIQAMSTLLQQGRSDFLFYPIIMFGSMIIPDFILPSIQITSTIKLFWLALLPFFLGFLVITFYLWKNIFVTKLIFFRQTVMAAILWTGLVVLIHKFNIPTFSDSRYVLLLLVGGYTIILITFLLLGFFKQKNASTALFLGLVWSILSFFFAWWWVPQSIFPTTYRYLIVSAAGISILLATIISLGREKGRQISLFAIFCVILILHIFATRIYINNLLDTHGQETSKKIWSSIPYVPEIGKSKTALVFYFEGDGTNGAILHDVITFGFPPHMALLYNLREENGGIPIPMSEWREVESAVTDGKSFKTYGYPLKPIPTDRIYAFRLEGKDRLIDITEIARKKLNETPK